MPATSDVTSHWHHSVEGLSTSSLDFYSALEEALKTKEAPVRTERIQLGEGGVLSDKRTYLRVSYERFVFDIGAAPFGKDFFFSWWLGRRRAEGALMQGCLSAIGVLAFYILVAKSVGVIIGFFVTIAVVFAGLLVWQQAGGESALALEDMMLGLPVIGTLYVRFAKPTTYYSEDSRMMFEETVHRVVLDVLAGILTVNNLKPLSPDEALPKKA